MERAITARFVREFGPCQVYRIHDGRLAFLPIEPGDTVLPPAMFIEDTEVVLMERVRDFLLNRTTVRPVS